MSASSNVLNLIPAKDAADKAHKTGHAIAGGVNTAKENLSATGEKMGDKISTVCK